jgi:hypothetical protein
MGRACSTHGAKRNAYMTSVRKLEGRRPPEDLDVGGSIILTWILGWGGMDCFI